MKIKFRLVKLLLPRQIIYSLVYIFLMFLEMQFSDLFFALLSCRAAQIELLHALANIANENNLGQGILVKIKFNIIASLYDYNPNLAAFMKVGVFSSLVG